MDRRVEVLDCTLRDGSYAVDFQFTAEETRALVAGLADAGVPWIEVGHGLGLGAQPKHGAAAASDEVYIEAAVSGAGSSRIGCFFIPGIGTYEQMKTAAQLGLGFLRVGTNAPEIETGLRAITEARELGLVVSSNLMKSYVLPPDDLCRATRLAVDAGAHVVTLVDSAGGMLPAEVATYVRGMVETVDAKIGFHGHNNLGLANACALAAVEGGARVIDSTLQGLGRSSGNAQTESMIFLYEKLGFETGIDAFKLLDLGEKMIRPRLGEAGFTGVQVTSGFALFHSSFLGYVDEAAARFGVDPRILIIEVSKINRNRPTRDLFLQVAARLAERPSVREVATPRIVGDEGSA